MLWINEKLSVLLPAAALAMLPLATSCDQVECGPGTFEDDGTCVLGDGFEADDPRCGAGTHLEDGECVPDIAPAVCDDTTTVPEVQPDGTVLCIGTGTGSGCGAVTCADPGGGGFVSLCGQIFDVETNQMVRAEGATGAPCDPDNPASDGPCALEVIFYDALGFAANPTGTVPQDADQIEINDCGHFKGIKVERPFSGQIAIGIDNAMGSGGDRLLAGIAITTSAGEQRKDLRAFAFSSSTNDKWTSSASEPFGATSFFEKGVYAPVFCSPDCRLGDPLTGVKVTRGGTVVAGDDYYFDDADPDIRASVSASQESTGANGAALMVNSALGQHSGTGGDVGSCVWQSELATSVPSALFFRESFTHEPGDPEAPCPAE